MKKDTGTSKMAAAGRTANRLAQTIAARHDSSVTDETLEMVDGQKAGHQTAIGAAGAQAAAFTGEKIAQRDLIGRTLKEAHGVFGTLSVLTGAAGGVLALTGVGLPAVGILGTASAAFGAAAIAAHAWYSATLAADTLDGSVSEHAVYQEVGSTVKELAVFGALQAVDEVQEAAQQMAGPDYVSRHSVMIVNRLNQVSHWLKRALRLPLQPILQDARLAARLRALAFARQLAETLDNAVSLMTEGREHMAQWAGFVRNRAGRGALWLKAKAIGGRDTLEGKWHNTVNRRKGFLDHLVVISGRIGNAITHSLLGRVAKEGDDLVSGIASELTHDYPRMTKATIITSKVGEIIDTIKEKVEWITTAEKLAGWLQNVGKAAGFISPLLFAAAQGITKGIHYIGKIPGIKPMLEFIESHKGAFGVASSALTLMGVGAKALENANPKERQKQAKEEEETRKAFSRIPYLSNYLDYVGPRMKLASEFATVLGAVSEIAAVAFPPCAPYLAPFALTMKMLAVTLNPFKALIPAVKAWLWTTNMAHRISESADITLHRIGGRIAQGRNWLGEKLSGANDGDLTGPFYPALWTGPRFDAHPASQTQIREEISKGAGLYVNGMCTSLKTHIETAQQMANAVNRPIVGIYNATGNLVTDALQSFSDKLFDIVPNKATKTLVGLITDYGDAKKPNGGLSIYAHSQGGIIVSEALRQAKKKGVNIGSDEVTTFGNAAHTMPEGARAYHHYVFDSDVVPTGVGSTSLVTRLMQLLPLAGMGLRSTAQDTTVLHHRGDGFRPHSAISSLPQSGAYPGLPVSHDGLPSYLSALPEFQAKERAFSAVPPQGILGHLKQGAQAEIAASASVLRSLGAAVFALGRGTGTWAAEGVGRAYSQHLVPGIARGYQQDVVRPLASRYDRMNAGIRGLPSLPFLKPNTLWGGIDQGIRGAGHLADAAVRGAGRWEDWLLRGLGRRILSGGAAVGRGHDKTYDAWNRVQRKGAGAHPDVEPTRLRDDLLRQGGTGATPDTNLRQQLSGHLGFDPAGARLHRGPAAAQAARNLNAEAFTIGRDVFFGEGRFDPASGKGLGLIAHELTHVGQQTGTTGDKTRFYTPTGGDEVEQEARQTEKRVLARAGNQSGLFVENYARTYAGEEGATLSRADQQRLDTISLLALREAERMLVAQGVGGAALDSVSVDITLDLTEMSDTDAARVWACAIAAALGTSRYSTLSGTDDIQMSWIGDTWNSAARSAAGIYHATASGVENEITYTAQQLAQTAASVRSGAIAAEHQMEAAAKKAVNATRNEAMQAANAAQNMMREVGAKASALGTATYNKAKQAAVEGAQSAKHKIGEDLMSGMGVFKGVLMEGTQAVDNAVWLVGAANGYKWDPGITKTVGGKIDAAAEWTGERTGVGPNDGNSLFSTYEMGELTGALGAQVALAFTGVEEVELAVNISGAVGASRQLLEAIGDDPKFYQKREFWEAIVGIALAVIGLKGTKAASKLTKMLVDALLLGTQGKDVVKLAVKLHEDSKNADLKKDSKAYNKQIAADVQALIKAIGTLAIAIVQHGNPQKEGIATKPNAPQAAHASENTSGQLAEQPVSKPPEQPVIALPAQTVKKPLEQANTKPTESPESLPAPPLEQKLDEKEPSAAQKPPPPAPPAKVGGEPAPAPAAKEAEQITFDDTLRDQARDLERQGSTALSKADVLQQKARQADNDARESGRMEADGYHETPASLKKRQEADALREEAKQQRQEGERLIKASYDKLRAAQKFLREDEVATPRYPSDPNPPKQDAAYADIYNEVAKGREIPTRQRGGASIPLKKGTTLYKLGTTGKSQGVESQFWMLENPLKPGVAERYGIPPQNIAHADFIITAEIPENGTFITRKAADYTDPKTGKTYYGTAMEVVVPPGEVVNANFVSLGEPPDAPGEAP